MKGSYITVTDQFCGAGGSSIGATAAGAEVRLAMNHWKLAIETHNTNFPKVDHDIADISAVSPRRYPSTDILITSPECTNHSLAKGNKRQYYSRDLFGNVLIDPSEERSRATMWDVPRFAEYHDYRMIVVENVVDAGKWRMFDAWLSAMHALDYDHEVVYFNSMFAWPTPQSRDRMYTVFWKRGNKRPDLDFRPVAWCQNCQTDTQAIQTWKKSNHWGRYKAQYYYRCPTCHKQIEPYYYAAFNAIDFSVPAERIGDRKRPLKPKTLARIQYGLDTYGRDPMIVTGRYTSGLECRVRDAMQDVMPTQPGDSSHAVVLPWIVETSHDGEGRALGVDSPLMTQTARQSIGLVGFLTKHYGGDPGSLSLPLSNPFGTITTQDHHSIQTGFIAELHGTSKASALDDPLMCVTANGNHHALLSADSFISYYYGQSKQPSRMSEPIGTMTGNDHAGLVSNALKAMTIDDLTFRMLHPNEIGKAMAFPDTYVVKGNQRQKVKQYGNAVTPPTMGMLMERCMATFE